MNDPRTEFSLINPKLIEYPKVNEYFSIFINHEKELDFLKGTTLHEKDLSGAFGNTKSRDLAKLLNFYGIDSWTNNPQDNKTTAQFILRYLGPNEECPEYYQFNPASEFVCVVELKVNRVYQLYYIQVNRV